MERTTTENGTTINAHYQKNLFVKSNLEGPNVGYKFHFPAYNLPDFYFPVYVLPNLGPISTFIYCDF